MSHGRSGITDGVNVCRSLDKRLTDRIHTLFHSEFQTLVVAIGECTDTEINSWQIETLAGAQLTTH
jgi:hypothetical protein